MKNKPSSPSQFALPLETPSAQQAGKVIFFCSATAKPAVPQEESLREKITKEIVAHSNSLKW